MLRREKWGLSGLGVNSLNVQSVDATSEDRPTDTVLYRNDSTLRKLYEKRAEKNGKKEDSL